MCQDSALPTLHNSRELYLVFPSGSAGKEADAEDSRDTGLIPGQEDPQKEMATGSSILA